MIRGQECSRQHIVLPVAPGDLEPFWLMEGSTKVERIVVSLPFSREVSRLERLKRSVAVYRLCFRPATSKTDLLALLAFFFCCWRGNLGRSSCLR